MSDLFFTSDEHHGHANIIKFCNRPFSNISECTEAIIDRHNSVVKPGSRVYHLGDIFWRTVSLKWALDIFHALNGQHYFIYGNHDEVMEKNILLREKFVWCKDLAQIEYKDQKIVLCHYAMRTWRNSHRGAWQLYGHTHGQMPENNSLSFDVGVDAWDFTPVSFEQVKIKMDLKIAKGHGDPMMEDIKKRKWLSEQA